ncbi:MAG: mechanosensitive ion channel [Balneolales bacterium]|nr:mechanosensitive ion channel [Balneolales bacterium]
MDSFNVQALYDTAIEYGISFGTNLLIGLLVFFAGLKVIKVLLKVVESAMEKYEFEPSLQTFLGSVLNFIMKLILFVFVAGIFGLETTTFIALLGAAGLAIGLALQGSLSNFAGGVIILVFKPYRVNDVIQWGDDVGLVEEINILYTRMRLFDFRMVTIPNGQLANSKVINYTEKEQRRVEMKVGISYSSSIPKAREVVLDIINKDERVLPEPAPVVVFTNFGDSSLDLSIRAWTKTADYWPFYWETMEKIKAGFDQNGISIPFPQRDVHLFQQDKKMAEK